jgi:hypothetical protein
MDPDAIDRQIVGFDPIGIVINVQVEFAPEIGVDLLGGQQSPLLLASLCLLLLRGTCGLAGAGRRRGANQAREIVEVQAIRVQVGGDDWQFGT